MHIDEIDVSYFDDDGMTGAEKLKLIELVVELKNKMVLLSDDLEKLRQRLDSGYYPVKTPLAVFCVKTFLALADEEADTITTLRNKLVDIHDRLYECAGVTSVVRGIQAEVNVLRPEFERLQAQFRDAAERVLAEKEKILQSN